MIFLPFRLAHLLGFLAISLPAEASTPLPESTSSAEIQLAIKKLSVMGRVLHVSTHPGEEPKKGGLLVARYGKGYFIYTSYSWFRQLPAGVPGAYRLFANLVSLGN